jgi:hypothetical protein
MKRARAEADDSLELLLDTICNMFGTIIFIALVVAVITSARTRERAEEEAKEQAAKIDAPEPRREDELEKREAELERMLAALPAPEGEAESRDETLAAEAQSARALSEIARRRAMLERYREALDRTRAGLSDAGRDIEPLREEIARLEDEIEGAKRAQERTIRTPLEREVDQELFILVVWQGKLFPICDLSTRPRRDCEALRQWDDRHVVAARCSTPVFRCDLGGLDIQRRVLLRADAGIPIGSAAELRGNPEFQRLLATLDPGQDLIGFEVSPDSFGDFAAAKEAFLDAGFAYSVHPNTDPLPNYSDEWIAGRPRGL